MKAMVLERIGTLRPGDQPLKLRDLPDPIPGPKDILLRVSACGVCHTELDEIEGRTPPAALPMILGHEVVGRVVDKGADAQRFAMGDRVGVAWIFSACGHCAACLRGEENLCGEFKATGRDAFGGYAEYMRVNDAFAYPIPVIFSDVEAAPLLCAGGVGYRSLRLCQLQDGQRLGLTGFGASGHLVIQMVRKVYPHTQVYVFARDPQQRALARTLGAVWTGDTGDQAPVKLNAIIDTTPAWKPVVEALKNLAPGGRLVINAIRKEAGDQSYLMHLDYATHLWLEKEIKSVANVTRRDVAEFLELAASIPIKPVVQTYPLKEANQALLDLKNGKIKGAKVLTITS